MTRSAVLMFFGLVALVLIGVRMTNSQSPGMSNAQGWHLPTPTSTGNEAILMHSGLSSSGANQFVLVDTAKKVMAVYFVSPETGVIQLKSVRNMTADFLLEEFNGSDPSPAKVRSIMNHP